MSNLSSASPLALQARWVFPVSGPPLRDATVTMFQGRIMAVGDPPASVPIEDLGQAAILPGLVNAHTHLEFSNLTSPIGHQGMGLVDWLRSVIGHRGSESATALSPIEQGLRQSASHGVTTIGEIAQPDCLRDPYSASPCGGVVFLELIAPIRERIEAALQAAEQHILETRSVSEDRTHQRFAWQAGLSPHAPYTVHPELLAQVVLLSTKHEAPLAMHLAESLEEIEFLRDGRGPFRDLLEWRNAWDPQARLRGSRPLDELRYLARAHRALVIHGNYLDDEEIAFLGRHRQRMAAVYCPRTHAWFGHSRYPLEKLLAAGAVVALGTDSRASSPDLSILAEMRQVARAFPGLHRATILELGTLGGAMALGLDTQVGSLEPGKLASLAAVALPNDPAADPHELLLDSTGAVIATWVQGNRLSVSAVRTL